jgi:transposase-like protein
MSDRGPRVFSTELKEEIVLRLEAGERISAVSAETGIRRKLLYQWRDAYRAMGVAGFNRKRGRKRGWKRTGSAALPALAAPASGSTSAAELAKAQARIAELERTIGRQQVDLDFFQKALRLWDATSPSGGAPISTRSSKK